MIFWNDSESFRGVIARFLRESSRSVSASFSAKSRGEKKNGLRELTQNLAEFSPRNLRLRIFVRGVNAKKELFWADLYIHVVKH